MSLMDTLVEGAFWIGTGCGALWMWAVCYEVSRRIE